MGEIVRDRPAVAHDRAAFGPGDGVQAAVGRVGAVHHAERGNIAAQQRHRDRRPPSSLRVLGGAVVRVDEPRPALLRARHRFAFLAAESARHEPLQLRAQALLDLAVDRRAAALAARAARQVELGTQARALCLDDGNDFSERQQRHMMEAGSISCLQWQHRELIGVRARVRAGQSLIYFASRGSATPSSANPLARSRHESQRLQGAPSRAGS